MVRPTFWLPLSGLHHTEQRQPSRTSKPFSTGAVAVVLGIAALLTSTSASADYLDHFATRTDVGLAKVPSQGTTRILVVPVFVDDQPYSTGDEASFHQEILDFYAPPSDDIFSAGVSFTGFYEQQSLGRYRPEVLVADPVHFPTCPPLGGHQDCRIPRGAGFADGDVQGAVNTLVDALRFLDEIMLCTTAGPSAERRCTSGGGVDLNDVDVSGIQAGIPDGFSDGVLVISNARFPGIALPVKDLASQPLLAFFGPFPEFRYSVGGGVDGDSAGVVVNAIGIQGFASPPARETLVSVHEFGHLLGFADLYNEAGTTTDLPWTYMGGWFYADAPSLLDPFSRLAIGWGNVVDVGGPGTYTIGSAGRTGEILKVGQGDEFFLVEHRRKEVDAFDGDLEADHGVYVERVQLAKRPSPAAGNYFNTLQNCVNCEAFNPMLMIEEADGDYDLQFGRGRDDTNDFFAVGDEIGPSDDTSPRGINNPVFSTNRLSGAKTGITIRVLAVDEVSATIEVEAPATADPCADLDDLCLQDCSVDDDGNGRCGDFVEFPARGAGLPFDIDLESCDCRTSSQPGALFAFAGLLALGVRRRRQAR